MVSNWKIHLASISQMVMDYMPAGWKVSFSEVILVIVLPVSTNRLSLNKCLNTSILNGTLKLHLRIAPSRICQTDYKVRNIIVNDPHRARGAGGARGAAAPPLFWPIINYCGCITSTSISSGARRQPDFCSFVLVQCLTLVPYSDLIVCLTQETPKIFCLCLPIGFEF